MSLSQKALSGNVETFILSVLEDAPSYGYEIVSALNERAPDLVSFGEGTVYPVLHRMEKKKLLEAFWQEGASARKRKYYRVTRSGKKSLADNLKEWRELAQAMEQITGKHPVTI